MEPPWSKVYDTSVEEMKLPLLLTSTLTDDSRTSTVTNKTCLICGWMYFYRPSHCRQHLGVGATGTNHVQMCHPFPEHIQSHAQNVQIVKELKERDARDEYDKIQDRESVKRSLQSGQRQTSWETERIKKWSGMSPSFMIVLITPLRLSPGFPRRRRHSRDSK